MGGLNLTGQNDVNAYFLGRGKLWVAALSAGLPDANGWRDVGNVPEFALSMETERLDHQSSRSGLKVIDKSVVISQKANIQFALDQLSFDNLAMFLAGTTDTVAYTNPAIAGVTNEGGGSALKLGRWYDLIADNGQHAVDIAKANLSVREDPDGIPATLTQDVDYEVNEKWGMIRFLTASEGGGATEGNDWDFTLAADAGASVPQELKALKTSGQTVALKFIGENPANNDETIHCVFHQVQLSADGNLGLISDEYAQMGFAGVLEENVLADADSPYATIRWHAAA